MIGRSSLPVAALCVVVLSAWVGGEAAPAAPAEAKVFRAGAAAVDISPKHFPAIVSGGFLAAEAKRVTDPLFARALVLDDGATRLAIVVVDSLMMPRELIDAAREQAAKATGIPTDHMLVSAVHTHSAPSVMGALGTGVDEDYAGRLPGWIAEAIDRAAKRLAPARVGWAVTAAPDHTHCRRWIKRPDRIGDDPFGARTVRAMMHPGYQNPDYLGPAGPVDAGLTVLAVQSPDGRPVALLANYSMHYFGAAPVSADYFGRFSANMARLVGADKTNPQFVAAMSQGTAGDMHWMDYGQPRKDIDIDRYSAEVARIAHEAYQKIRYHNWVPLAVAERKLTLGRRVPDEKRLAWAQQVIGKMKDPKRPTNIPEVYALEQFYLRKEPRRELRLQAMRIGGLGVAAFPAEVFAMTGLKIKAQSPLEPTFNVELANGADGYIPPPEQHELGGYTTWPARSAGLEIQAEPRIVETLLELLEQVAGKPRRAVGLPGGAYERAVLQSKPAAYWRLEEFAGSKAADASGHNHPAQYHEGVALYLEGAAHPGLSERGKVNRAPHLAGGWIEGRVGGLGAKYSVELWFCNALPNDARPHTGCLVARRKDAGSATPGEHLGLGGTASGPGKLIVFPGGVYSQLYQGRTTIAPRTWNHAVVVRDGGRVAVYLNANPAPEIDVQMSEGLDPSVDRLVIGGGHEGFASFEGKIDEVAVYGRVLPAEEVAAHYAAGVK